MDVIFLKLIFRYIALLELVVMLCTGSFVVFHDTVSAESVQVINTESTKETAAETPKELSQLYAQSACLLDGKKRIRPKSEC